MRLERIEGVEVEGRLRHGADGRRERELQG